MINALVYTSLAGMIAFLVSCAAIPLIKRIAIAMRAVDYPGGRHRQEDAIPRMGGAAVITGLVFGAGTVLALNWGQLNITMPVNVIISLVMAALIIFLSGIIEDTIGLSPFIRVLIQMAAALVAIQAGWCFTSITLPVIGTINFGIFTGLVSLLWIVGVTNAVNLLDGLDGLAGGVIGIIGAGMMMFALWQHDYPTVILMGALIGACIGFLRKNWAPAQIYLGDAGSLTFGFLLALVSIRSSFKAPAAVAILVPMLALGLPVIDTLLVMVLRFSRKSSRSLSKRTARMFHPDRNHLHHLLERIVYARSRIVLVIYSVSLLFCGLALLVAMFNNMVIGILLFGFEIVVVFGMRYLGLHADALRISREKRKGLREMLFRKNVVQFKDTA